MFCASLMRIHNYEFYKTQNKQKKNGKKSWNGWKIVYDKVDGEVSKKIKNESKSSSSRRRMGFVYCECEIGKKLVEEMASAHRLCYRISFAFVSLF